MGACWARRAFFALAVACASFSSEAGTITYFHNDLLGSPVAASNASGQIIWHENYRPFGERLVDDANSTSNKIWYSSRYQDAETGLVYMGARYYDPVVGRFLGVDPKLLDQSNPTNLNRYSYANNNPYRFRDADGRAPTPLDAAFVVWDTAKLVKEAATGGDVRGASIDLAISAGSIFIPVPGIALAIKAERTAEVLRAAEHVVDAAQGANTVFKTEHYASRLEKAGISVTDAEAAVAREIAAMRNNMQVDADVAGRINVGGSELEYRARLRENGSVAVGTIFEVK